MKDVKNSAEKSGTKREYVKPRLRRIQLAAGEVLAEGCKLDDGGRNVGMDNLSCTQPTVCVTSGS